MSSPLVTRPVEEATDSTVDVCWPPTGLNSDVFLNLANRSLIFALKSKTHFVSAVTQLAFVLEEEPEKTIINIQSDQVQIIEALKNSKVSKRLLLEESESDVAEFISSENKILIDTSHGVSSLKGLEVPVVVVFCDFVNGKVNKNIFTRCTSKLILVCDEVSAKNLIPSNGSSHLGKVIPVHDYLMPVPFEDAIKKNSSGALRNFLNVENQISVDIRNEASQTGLMIACQFGCSDAANELLMNENNPPELDAVDSQGWTALHHASDCGSLDCLKMIVEKGFSISSTTNKGETALHLAAAKDHFELVDWLITAQNCSLESKTSFPDRNGQLQIRTALHLATLNGNLKSVECLLQKTAEVDNTDQDGNTCLHIAAEVGNVKITEVLKAGADINVKNGDGTFPLHLASHHGHLDVVKFIVNECPAKLNIKDDNGFTPIILAASNGHSDVTCFLKGCLAKINLVNQTPLHLASREGCLDEVKRLVKDCLADVNCKDGNGLTPLHLASENGHLDVVKCFVKECGADVNLKSNAGVTPLEYASEHRHLDVVKWLVNECKADVNVKGDDGSTPLHHASENGHLDVVKCLVHECGANVNLKIQKDGWTPLLLASEHEHLDVVKYLVNECGADVNLDDDNGMAPIHRASQLEHLDAILCLVNECKADVNMKDYFGKTSLHRASEEGLLDVVKCLVNDCGANVNLKSNDGVTPLEYACTNENLDVVKCLVNECGADVNLANGLGHNVLHFASSKGRLDVVRCLVSECFADVNLKEKYGDGHSQVLISGKWVKTYHVHNTALHYASKHGHLKVTKFLTNEGQADVNLQNEEGWTALHFATSRKHYETVEFLLESQNADAKITTNGSTVKEGKSCFKMAVENEDFKMARIILQNAHHIYEEVLEFLFVSSEKEDPTWVDFTLKNYKDKGSLLLKQMERDQRFHNTALHCASKKGYLKVTKFLVNECQADVNLQNKDGWTALHFATDRKHYETVEFLLESQKVDARIKTNGSTDMEGKSYLEMAVENEDFKIVQLFLQKAQLFLEKAHIHKEVQEFLFVSSENEDLIWVDFILKNYKDKFSLLLISKERDQSVMTFAVTQGKLKSLLLMISFLINEKENEELKNIMGDILHCKNSEKMTLLEILISQGQPSRFFCPMLFTLEQEAHNNIESFCQCVNLNLGPSKVAMEAIKNADNHYKSKNAADNENSKVNFSTKMYFWVKFLLTLALLPFILSVLDISTDCVQIIETWKTYNGSVNKTMVDYSDELASCNNTALEQLIETSQNIVDCYQLYFLIFFICLPLVPYVFEWFNNTSIGYRARFKETNDGEEEKSVNRRRYLESNLILWWILQVFVILFWPFVCLILKVASNVEYSVKEVKERPKSYAKKMSETTSGEKAILSEVCTESSFQPLLQMYLLIPFLIQKLECSTVLSSSEGLKLISILTSILALSFSFSSYIASTTNGAMPKLSGGFLLVMVQCALQITGRVVLLTFLGYCSEFFWAGLGFAIFHIMLVFFVLTLLSCLSKFQSAIENNVLNAFANLYLQIETNEIDRLEEKELNSVTFVKSDRTTKITYIVFVLENLKNVIRGLFKVQPTFWIEPLILLENLLIAVVVWTNMRDNYIAVWSVSVGLLLYIGGLCLKLVYLKYIHFSRHLNSFEYLITIGKAKPKTEHDEMELGR